MGELIVDASFSTSSQNRNGFGINYSVCLEHEVSPLFECISQKHGLCQGGIMVFHSEHIDVQGKVTAEDRIPPDPYLYENLCLLGRGINT